MKAYKGFHKDLTCSKGLDIYQYNLKDTFSCKEQIAKTRANGFHATKKPLDVLAWYSSYDDRFFIVDLFDDISEIDGITCSTKIKLLKELTIIDLIKEDIRLFLKNSDQSLIHNIKYDEDNKHYAKNQFKHEHITGSIAISKDNNIYIKNDKIGNTLLFITIIDNTLDITSLEIDNEKIKPDTYYNKNGEEL